VVGPEPASIGAVAFAFGRTLYFAPGRFDPDSPGGRFLLGHELTHVLQQKAGRVCPPGAAPVLLHDPTLEAEADRMGLAAAGRARVPFPPLRSVRGSESGGGEAIQAVMWEVVMKSQIGCGGVLLGLVDLNCGWYCLEAAMRMKMKQLFLKP